MKYWYKYQIILVHLLFIYYFNIILLDDILLLISIFIKMKRTLYEVLLGAIPFLNYYNVHKIY